MNARLRPHGQNDRVLALVTTRPLGTKSCCAVVTALLFVVGDPVLYGIQPDKLWEGQRVMVVRDGAQFLVQGERQNAPAPLGTVLEVSNTNGPWLWFKGQRGWLKQSDVALYDKAIKHFTDEIQRNPTALAYHGRGIAHAAMENFEKASDDFTEAIRRDESNIAAFNDRGNAFRKLGRLDEALADFTAVINRGVRHAEIYTNRGLARHEKRDYDQALTDFNTAIEIDSRFAPAWDGGGAAREAMGEFAKAIANYKKAIAVDPNFDRAHNNLAWILATHPDAKFRDAEDAIRHATKACELTSFSDAGYLDTLAAAHAEAGQFDQAIAREKEALDKASTEEKAAIKERLQLYESSKPFRVSDKTKP